MYSCIAIVTTYIQHQEVLDQTRETELDHISNTEKWVEKTRRSRVFLNLFRGVGYDDPTLFQVFDIASQIY